MLIDLAALHDFFLADISAEIESRFPRLSKIPDTQVVRALDYFYELNAGGQSALTNALARRAAWVLCQEEQTRGTRRLPTVTEADNPYFDSDLEYLRYCDACLSSPARGGLRYTPIRMLKGIQNDENVGGLPGWFERMRFDERLLQPVPELLPDPAIIEPVSLEQLQRQIENSFARRFSATITKIAPAFWRYEGSLGDTQLRLHLDFNPRVEQLRYRVQINHTPTGLIVGNLNLEYLWGFGWGGWNYLTQENLRGSIELLGELISELALLPQRLFSP